MIKLLHALLVIALMLGLPLYSSLVSADEVVEHHLSWTAPITRADGTDLPAAEIGGYRVYAKTPEGDYKLLDDVGEGAVTTYTAAYWVPADATFSATYVVTCYDIGGLESEYSLEATKTSSPKSSAGPGVPGGTGVTDRCARGCDQPL